MLKTIIEIWPVMVMLAVIVMGLGRALWVLDDLVKENTISPPTWARCRCSLRARSHVQTAKSETTNCLGQGAFV